MLLKLHTKVPQSYVTSYLLLSKATPPEFPQQKKKFSQHEVKLWAEQKQWSYTAQKLQSHIFSEFELNPYWFFWARLSAPAQSILTEPGNKRILVAPKTSVKQTAAFSHGVFKWDMPLTPPNPQLSSWQPQQAWGWPSAETQILLAPLSCTDQRWVQPDARRTHSPTHQQTSLTSAGSLLQLRQLHLGVVGWLRQKNFYLRGPIASCPLLPAGGGVAPPSYSMAHLSPWYKDH